MREPRNPFRLRASEHIESEETFIRLFSPDVLEIFGNNDIWGKPQIIRSAPGGGKSSLLRLFTPQSLLTIYEMRTRDHTEDLFLRLQYLEAINEKGPLVLGIYLSCSNGYAALADLNIDAARKQRLLLSLLNARIALAALQGIVILKGLSYPNDLKHLQICPQNIDSLPPGLMLPCSGHDFYIWASSLEKNICDAIDSFDPLSNLILPGHDSLNILRIVTPENFKYNNSPIIPRIFIMLDDLHQLTSHQRRVLMDEIIKTRYPIPIWIAERLEALEMDELVSSGAIKGRDYEQVINIEEFWSGGSNKRFERAISNIANRRAREAREVELSSFAECLAESLDGNEWQEKFRQGSEKVITRVRKKAEGKERYKEWIAEREQMIGTDREIAIGWRALEILIERDQLKKQKSFDFALPAEDLQQKDVSGIRAAAELFFSREFDIPYYYGMPRLATMTSANIEQFLWLAGDLFEESLSKALLNPKKSKNLSPERQEAILKRTIKEQWKNLPQRVKYGTEVCKFLESVGKYAQWETNRPNAPYVPGVTGIAISMRDRKVLIDSKKTNNVPDFSRLADTLMSCIAHNLIEVRLDCKQGQVGHYWMVMYLNRMLCVHLDLPLQYGGWREKSLRELVIWIKKGFTPPPKSSELFL